MRPAITRHVPVHVTMRISAAVGSMRKRHMYRAVQQATLHAFAAKQVRIVHFSIQHDHLHAIVEADDRDRLARGLQGFQICAARRINTKIQRTGTVFTDRYHARLLTNPRQVRNTIAYVLNNWRRHREDRRGVFRGFRIDPFASSIMFSGWANYEFSTAALRAPPTYEPLWVYLPTCWLLRVGWQRHGLLDVTEVPARTCR